MTPVRANPFTRLLLWIARRIFALRYRVTVQGLDAVRAKGRQRILFLSNHPALIDPVMLVLWLYGEFEVRSLADEVQVDRPVIGWLARRFGAQLLPNLERQGAAGRDRMREAVEAIARDLEAGANVLLYPAGHLKHGRLEEIGAASAVRTLLDRVTCPRVVLVRQNGLWGSRFSVAATGRMPRMADALVAGLKVLLLNGLFFTPRRPVRVELVEPGDLPRDADRLALNQYLEAFFNEGASPNLYVPYHAWERGGARELPDPPPPRREGDATGVQAATRRLVIDQLESLTGRTGLGLADRLSMELGLDSLAIADLTAWIEREFGFPVGSPESLVTVGDVVLAASGKGISASELEIRPASARWFAVSQPSDRVAMPLGDTITGVFLARAAQDPGQVVLADQATGERTYRDVILALLLLTPRLAALPGQYVGIMLPASVGAGVFFLAALFAGKTPVMVNWTAGVRSVTHSLDLLGVRHVVTARALLARLDTLGIDLGPLADRFVYAENLRAGLGTLEKIRALAASRFNWATLRRARPPETAVVLFTSGSEALPKAVPLTHRNLLTNIRDTLGWVAVYRGDAIVGMLPPFHSFGITVTTVLPLCSGVRTVYHPNPMESAVLARTIEAFRVTLLVGTPTFLHGIVRVARQGQLDSLRLAVTGAEKCPAAVYASLEARCPHLTVLEGYGITECSPIVSVNVVESPVRSSIGHLQPSLEGVIVNPETHVRVPDGETGMLLVRGPTVFGGYLHHDGPSPFVEFDGRTWYRTGDLVSQAPDGVLFFQGRLKRFIKLGGEMISLPAIEAALWPVLASDSDQGPPIAVDAVGDPDNPDITLFTTRDVSRQQVNTWLREAGLSALNFVRQVVRVESIPVLGTGKTDYRRLQQDWAAGAK